MHVLLSSYQPGKRKKIQLNHQTECSCLTGPHGFLLLSASPSKFKSHTASHKHDRYISDN